MTDDLSRHRDTICLAIITISSAALAAALFLIDLPELLSTGKKDLPSLMEWVIITAAATSAATFAIMMLYARFGMFRGPRQEQTSIGDKQQTNSNLFSMAALMAAIPLIIVVITSFATLLANPEENREQPVESRQIQGCLRGVLARH